MSRYIDEHRGRFGVEPICSVLGVSASAYYQRATGQRSARRIEDERLLARIREVHQANYCAYGYRRTWKALLRAGERVPRCQVQRLMRDHGIQGAKRRGKPWRTTTPDPDARRRPDLVNRDFTANRPNELWVADFSYLRCWEGLVFFSFVIDVHSRMVVGWQFASHMRTTLVLDALRMALTTRERVREVRLVHHSDRGSQAGLNWSSQPLIMEVCMGRPAGWMRELTGRAPMKSPGHPTHRRDVERLFWHEIVKGLSSEDAAVAVGASLGGWQPVVPGTWRDANVHARPALGPVSVVSGAGGDRDVEGAGRRGQGDRSAAREFAVDGLEGVASQRGYSRREARLSRVGCAVEGRD